MRGDVRSRFLAMRAVNVPAAIGSVVVQMGLGLTIVAMATSQVAVIFYLYFEAEFPAVRACSFDHRLTTVFLDAEGSSFGLRYWDGATPPEPSYDLSQPPHEPGLATSDLPVVSFDLAASANGRSQVPEDFRAPTGKGATR